MNKENYLHCVGGGLQTGEQTVLVVVKQLLGLPGLVCLSRRWRSGTHQTAAHEQGQENCCDERQPAGWLARKIGIVPKWFPFQSPSRN